MPSWAKWMMGCGCAAALLVAIAVGGCTYWVAKRPRTWHVEQAIEISAAPDEIRPLLEDLARWPEWSAWTRDVHSQVARTYEGASAGSGAVMRWEQPAEVELGGGPVSVRTSSASMDAAAGRGSLEIVSADADELTLRTTYEDGLVFALTRVDASGSSSQTTRIDEAGQRIVIPGSIRIESRGAVTRVVWSEEGDLGEGLVQGFVAVSALPMIRAAHEELLRASLDGLKRRVERPR